MDNDTSITTDSNLESLREEQNILQKKMNLSPLSVTTGSVKEQETTYKTLTQEINEKLIKIKAKRRDFKGYLEVAKLYSCQGNQQGAVELLEKGLCTITSKANAHVLRQQLDAIKAQRDRRIDFISQCPYEIVCNIVGYLDNHQVHFIHCIDVSQGWRSKLLSCSSMWHQLMINASYQTDHQGNNKLQQIIPLVNNHVEHLQIFPTTRENINQYIVTMLETYKFSNLKFLAVSDAEMLTHGVDFSRRINMALSFVGSTLTELQLCLRASFKVSLECIISTCRKLLILKLDIGDIKEIFINGIALPEDLTSTSLLHLELATSCSIPTVILEPILHHSPHLRYLVVNCLRWADLMCVLQDYCPKLEVISTCSIQHRWDAGQLMVKAAPTSSGIYRNQHPVAVPRKITEKDNDNSSGKLRYLVLDNITSAEYLRPRLEKCVDTLEKLSLAMVASGDNNSSFNNPRLPDDWRGLSCFSMNKLTDLHITNGTKGFYEHFPAIIQCFPALKSLCLEQEENDYIPGFGYRYGLENESTRNSVFNALIQAENNLSTLKLIRMNINCEGFERMLDYYGEMSVDIQQQDLRDILQSLTIIVNHDSVTAPRLRQISKIKSLRSLRIEADLNHQLISSEITEFAQLLASQEASLLSKLDLRNIPFTDDAARSIVKCKNLQSMSLYGFGARKGFTQRGRKLLAKHIKELSTY
ncbi:hypothetical protein BDA99DRAFT_531096 [Phascolomyces articulosus]|uniref:F-box domain-containing protein n=1 Tax=Phascolomyces articulosus TaxID=60185 RepID=A0AAD5KPT6_9FUNG|nr:hypothetical protein BDA99DRAFT_531096 [Phascolomyces articulosus]